MAQPRACCWRWESRLANPFQLHDSGDRGAPLLLNIIGGTLQELIDKWHQQYAVHALTEHQGCLFLQLCRYDSHTSKNMQTLPVRPGDSVALPVFTDTTGLCTRLELFRVAVVVYHLGASVTSGHYKTLIGTPTATEWSYLVCKPPSEPPNVISMKLITMPTWWDCFAAHSTAVGPQGCPQFHKPLPLESQNEC